MRIPDWMSLEKLLYEIGKYIPPRLKEPINNNILFNDYTLTNLNNNLCPLCGKYQANEYVVRIGYTSKYEFSYYVLWIEVNRRELYTFIPICNICRDFYLRSIGKKKYIANPSSLVLKEKVGFYIGLIYPYTRNNIQAVQTSLDVYCYSCKSIITLDEFEIYDKKFVCPECNFTNNF